MQRPSRPVVVTSRYQTTPPQLAHEATLPETTEENFRETTDPSQQVSRQSAREQHQWQSTPEGRQNFDQVQENESTHYTTLTCVCKSPYVFLLDDFLTEEECRRCEVYKGPGVDAMLARIAELTGALPTGREVKRFIQYDPVEEYFEEDTQMATSDADGESIQEAEEEEDLAEILSQMDPAAVAEFRFPDGLHVDVNNGYWMRHVSALVYLDDVCTERHSGATVFPLAGCSEDDPDLHAARALLESNMLHTSQAQQEISGDAQEGAKRDEDDSAKEKEQGEEEEEEEQGEEQKKRYVKPEAAAWANALLARACRNGDGLRVDPRRGRLCLFLNYDDRGRVDPRSWHGAEAMHPAIWEEWHHSSGGKRGDAERPGKGDQEGKRLVVRRRLWTVFKEMPMSPPLQVAVSLQNFAGKVVRDLKEKIKQSSSDYS